jgi:hypothetical protein
MDGRCWVGGGGSCGAAAEAMTTTTYKWETRNTFVHFYLRHQVPVNGIIITVKMTLIIKRLFILTYGNPLTPNDL